MINNIIIELPLIDQGRDTHNKKWAHRTCAICCLKMMLAFKNPKYLEVPIMELVKKVLANDGYLENVGFKHKALVDLAAKYGITMDYQKIFFYKLTEKEKGLNIINRQIDKGLPVIISINSQTGKGSHMIIVRGIKKKGRIISGYHIQDPDSRWKGNNYFLNKPTLLKIWRGGMVVFKN